MNLKQLQKEQGEWSKINFPDAKKYQPLLGLIEELGELSHSHLKAEQGIRGTEAEHRVKIADAIGDMVIFLSAYCNQNDFDLESCVALTWQEVKRRNWKPEAPRQEEREK